MGKGQGLSDLEYAVMGVVALAQPCTAYRVRMAFLESPSGHWSGSAGAIYPAMRRLETRGLLHGSLRPGDRRSTKVYQHTAKGRVVFQAWLRPPLPDAGELMTLDPLRVRVRFLATLPAGERLPVVWEAEEKLREQVRRLARDISIARKDGDVFEHLAHRGALLSLRAQLKFLGEVRAELKA